LAQIPDIGLGNRTPPLDRGGGAA